MINKFLVLTIWAILIVKLSVCSSHLKHGYHLRQNVFLADTQAILDPEQFLSTSRVQYNGSQLLKIHTRDRNNDVVKFLKKLGADIWNINIDGIDMFLESNLTSIAKKLFDQSDITYNIMIEDIQKVIDENGATPVTEGEVNVSQLLHKDLHINWDQYQDLNAIDEFLHMILDAYPKITHLITTGRSVERRRITVLKVSNQAGNNPAILITGGVQGRDWISPATITYVLYKFINLWREQPRHVKAIDWYFLPVLNPDGYDYSRKIDRLWNKNRRTNGECQGVNINRNFGFGWSGKGSSGLACSRNYRGPERFSEPETKALRKIIRSIGAKLAAYISVGSYGQLITYPFGDNDYIPDNAEEMHRVAKIIRKKVRKVARTEYQVGSSYRWGLPNAGNSADWVLKTTKCEYVYNLLLRDQGRYGFLLPPSLIKESGEELYAMVKTVAEAVVYVQSK